MPSTFRDLEPAVESFCEHLPATTAGLLRRSEPELAIKLDDRDFEMDLYMARSPESDPSVMRVHCPAAA